jgi:hypothetical protein
MSVGRYSMRLLSWLSSAIGHYGQPEGFFNPLQAFDLALIQVGYLRVHRLKYEHMN